ncbi:hypothetical protein [Paenibacillus tyrfis]|uniref:hypothetical protein n=1 Tax=Paenibacillus tyrfis TaxID=1501230 RepID=UPI00068DDADC|nr:hypothetical protein [Paenibacillus tyrfis]
MAAANHGLIREGDWVSGTSWKDERFIGYVEWTDGNGALRVRITQCDRTEAVGFVTEARQSKVTRLPEPDGLSADEAALHDLIELALQTRDQAWFEELSAMLPSASAQAAGERKPSPPGPSGWKAPASRFPFRFNLENLR